MAYFTYSKVNNNKKNFSRLAEKKNETKAASFSFAHDKDKNSKLTYHRAIKSLKMSDTVYISQFNEQFHDIECNKLKGISTFSLYVEDAINEGYTVCEDCLNNINLPVRKPTFLYVYIMENSSFYHRRTCSSIDNKAHKTELTTDLLQKYKPHNNNGCNPPKN